MRALRKFAAWLLGGVFFVAGILKLMDPVGAGLIVGEYFKFFGTGFLMFSAKAVGVALAFFETVLGAAIITGVWRKVIAVISLGVLGFFTVLTGILWIFNPNMDCGCFGEAIHLTHAQSFIKNVVLLCVWALAYLPLRKLLPTQKVKYVSFTIAALSVLFFMVWSLRSIPMMDFTAFRPGAELVGSDEMASADDPVLSPLTADYEYADSLVCSGNVLVISVYDPDRFDARRSGAATVCMEEASAAGFTPMLLAGANLEGSYFVDRRTLMTLNRSNGGATFIADGQIVRKWSANALPGSSELERMASTDPTASMIKENSPQRIKLQAFLLYVFAVMLLL